MRRILIAENLTKKYQHREGLIYAIKDVSLLIESGSFITITGPSGSGKTTLLFALSGLLRPTSGNIYFKNKKLDLSSEHIMVNYRKNHIGFIMQNFALIPYLTAIQNVMLPMSLNGHSTSKQRSKGEELMKLVGLGNRIYHFPRELSVGQQQRVAIARALANDPSMIFADEPTGNLDPALASEILEIFSDLNQNRGLTILMVTHSPEASDYGNHKIQLEEGALLK